jgi:hypothetical protein
MGNFLLVEAMLNIVNLVVATFTLVYGIIFIIESVKSEERLTWNFLVLAIMVFFGIQALRLLMNFNVFDTRSLVIAFETVFNGLLLYVFIFQRDLLKKYASINIHRRKHIRSKSSKKKRK